MALRKNIRSYEERVEKLTRMRDKLVAAMGDPEFYGKATAVQTEAAQKKYVEVIALLEQAEAQWLAALEKLDVAA